MPNYVRWRERGASYFFTLVTHKRRPISSDESARRLLKRSMAEARRQLPFDMFACVLLPDHLHCLWTLPDDDDDFPKRWSIIKRFFSKAYVANGGFAAPIASRRTRKRELGVWQPRYWEHRIRNEEEWYAYRDYIHWNPVKHDYVECPADWPWSSIHRHIQKGWVDPHWPGAKGLTSLELEYD
jgi:putative transposase